MSIFQNTVVNKYLKNQNEQVLSEKWTIYKAHFLNPTIQENIRNAKEEQYQEGFLRDLFVDVFGYTLNPANNFNLTTELKNVKDSKKADGGIIIDDKVFGVIELKGTNTTDLTKVEAQAFGYKNNQTGCVYVITSNFEKLRFYIDNAIEHIEFNLFTLTEQDFKLLYLCVAFENIKKHIPKKLKEESLSQEEEITKQLYKDYSLFKRELFQDLTKQNPQFEPLELFKKSQKLLDRFLFLFFAEDRSLLPPNSVRLILTQWKQLKDLDAYSPLYERFKKYFGYLNTGFKGKQYDIFAYNGGLFKPDEVLANIVIDDDLLYKHTLKLADYDFASEVDVNILGHIFENSLNELDEVKAQLEGTAIDKSTTKRKKDGVFYTPKYITKYIVENTIGKLCIEMKTALAIIEDDYFTDKKRQKKTIKPLVEKLKQYRDWLLQLTICDPACGSGAFLNEALNFLITEHGYIDELQAKLFGDAMVLSDVENSILENNLFGVDLNEESVEIAKLSLWLRTAQPNRKLNNLNNNIKCGNSLIDDITVAGDKAFNWENEFPEIFTNGGFDVVIGNPPYVKEATNKNAFNGLHSHPCYQGKMDLWYFFGWLGLEIAKPEKGLISYIAPNNWTTNDGASNFRNKIVSSGEIEEFIDFGDFKVFEDAGIQTMIYLMKNSSVNNYHELSYSKLLAKNVDYNDLQHLLNKLPSNITSNYIASFERDSLENSTFIFINKTKTKLIKSLLKKGNFHLTKDEIFSGIDIGQDFVNKKSQQILGDDFEVGEGVFNLSQKEFKSYNFSNEEIKLLKPFYTTIEIKKYFSNAENEYWVIYTSSKFKNPLEIVPYPNLKKHLDKFNKIITSDNKPYGIHRTRNEDIFLGEKILSTRKCSEPSFSYVSFDSYVNRTFNIIKSKRIGLKFLTALLNSSTVKFWLKEKGKLQGDMFQVDMNPIISIPIVKVDDENNFIEKADQMLLLNKDLQVVSQKFQRILQRKFEGLEKLPKKLENWYNLPFADFIKELKKKKIELSFEEEGKWEDYFLSEQEKAVAIESQINQTDKEIDAMVYKLYDLTEEEIRIVEGS